MPTTLAQFHTLVSNEIRRGTTLDAEIPTFVKRAARWVEDNYPPDYTMKFMRGTLNSSATDSHVIPALARPIRVDFVRLAEPTTISDTPEVYSYLDAVTNTGRSSLGRGAPQQYWRQGIHNYVMDRKPDKDYVIEALFNQFSVWPTDTTETHWLLDNAQELLLMQTLFYMLPRKSDPKAMQEYKALRDDAVKVFINAQDSRHESNTDDRMLFDGEEV